jgi:hypothetical protein
MNVFKTFGGAPPPLWIFAKKQLQLSQLHYKERLQIELSIGMVQIS